MKELQDSKKKKKHRNAPPTTPAKGHKTQGRREEKECAHARGFNKKKKKEDKEKKEKKYLK